MINRIVAFCASRHAGRQLKRFENLLARCQATQQQVLHGILERHRDSDFGRHHGFDRVRGYDDFRAAVPAADYRYCAPWIDRCRQGDTHALLGRHEKLCMFALTSGTTAAAKHIPVTESFLAHYRRGWNIWGIQALQDHPQAILRRILQVASPAEQERTPAGVPCGAISGMLARHQKGIVRRFYITPSCVADIADAAARYYTIMRLALVEDVGFISTANPSTTLTLAQTAERHAEKLIRDIHDGVLDPTLAIDPAIRGELAGRLGRRPERARTLEGLLAQHGRLLPRHYWKVAFLANWTGGTLGLYLPRLREYYGPTPIRDIGLLASEGRMSIPLSDHTAAGPLDIEANFYEFVPADEIDGLGDLERRDTLPDDLTYLPAHEVIPQEDYYLLLTNRAGLYRYHIGDLVRVTGRHGGTPIIEFLSKGAHTSSLTGEKLTENQVVNTVRRVADELAIKLDNFIVAPQWGTPPHYRVFFESNRPLPAGLLEQFGQRIDSHLALANIEYDSKRDSQRLGPVSARQLPAEMISRRDRRLMQANHGRAEQFKHRFLLNQPVDFAGDF